MSQRSHRMVVVTDPNTLRNRVECMVCGIDEETTRRSFPQCRGCHPRGSDEWLREVRAYAEQSGDHDKVYLVDMVLRKAEADS